MHDKEYWINRIKEILANNESETYQLDFKSGEELLINRNRMVRGKPVPITRNEVIFDIVRDVSAMAHAAGGAIIYGIKEKNDHSSEAGLIVPVKETDYLQKESLEHIITSNLLPPISAFQVLSIPGNEFNSETYTANADEKLIVIEVDRATTAHMVETNFGKNIWQKDNKISRRYYERVETQTFAMNGSRVKDVMGRSVKPKVVCTPYNEEKRNYYFLKLRLVNESFVVANNWRCNCVIEGFSGIETDWDNFFYRGGRPYGIGIYSPRREHFIGNKEKLSISWHYTSERVLHPTEIILLPQKEGTNIVKIHKNAYEINLDAELKITVYADDMVPEPITIPLGRIPIGLD